jgi:hypothetical protein
LQRRLILDPMGRARKYGENMRAAMFLLLTFAILSPGMARAQESVTSSDVPAADKAQDKAVTTAASKAKVEEAEFEPPAGFRAKKRGKYIVYCIEDSTVGTRFKSEKCYDEAQMKAYLLAREQNNQTFDQHRAVCSNPGLCASP